MSHVIVTFKLFQNSINHTKKLHPMRKFLLVASIINPSYKLLRFDSPLKILGKHKTYYYII
jgi:hypothetical protein